MEIIKVNTNQIVNFFPSNVLDELMHLGEIFNSAYWRVGDIVNEMYTLSLANGSSFGKLEICGAVADVIGKSARSVRYYASVSAFYPPNVRQEYEVLPFSHFAFAMQYSGEWENKQTWRAILDHSLDKLEKYGMPVSTERLAGIFHRISDRQIEANHYGDELPKPLYAEADIINIEDTPPQYDVNFGHDNSGNRRGEVVQKINNLLAPLPILLSTLAQLDGRSDVAQEIARVIAEIRNLQEVVSGESGAYFLKDEMINA